MLMKAQTQKRPENRALDQGLRLGLRLFAVCVFVTITIVMATFAVLATCQRIVAGAHYVSDTLAGAAIAFAVAALVADRLFWDAGFEHNPD